MANHKSAIKRIRVNKRRQLRNRMIISKARTIVRKARESLAGKDKAQARQAVLEAIRTLDKAANKGVLHKNNAARRKARLMKRLNAIEAGQS